MEKFTVRCPRCNKAAKVSEKIVGRKYICSRCKSRVLVPLGTLNRSRPFLLPNFLNSAVSLSNVHNVTKW